MSYEVAVVGGLLGVSFLWMFLAFNLKKTDEGGKFNDKSALQLLLILMTFLSVAVILFVMHLIAQNHSEPISLIIQNVFQGYIYVLMFVVAFYFIMFLIYIVNFMRVKK